MSFSQGTPDDVPAAEASAIHDAGLAASYTALREDEAIALARERYGLEGQVTRFATEKDDTFRLELPGGERFVLKVANPLEEVPEIDFQVRLLEHIEGADPHIPVPRVIRDLAHRPHAPFVDAAGQQRVVRLMSYVAGTPLDSVASCAADRAQVGRMLGRLRHATAGFSHPAQDRVLAWDVRHLQRLRPLLDDIDDPHQHRRVAAGLARLADLAPRIARLRTQVLHNDFSQSNIVVDAGQPGFVTGIIDFGDAVRTAVAVDVSTALLNQLPRQGVHVHTDLFADGRDLLRGYLAVADLTPEELALIPHLTMARAVARALLSLWRAKRFPENATYLLRNTEPGWAQLDWFLARTEADLSDTLPAALR
ncbi:phosphotransferase [Variovorax sp. UMC13]|uniref:phosphotransferase n=1 Tax=Variovorax sp. UMC13 TaxID=1862326 RepID=UPI001600D65B|nr:phosphotransferase [Variovorax sp. UMC13]